MAAQKDPDSNAARCQAPDAADRFPDDLKRLRAGLLFVLRRRVGSRALAEDFCNEAFRLVLERPGPQSFDDSGRLTELLLQAANGLVIGYKRRQLRQQTLTGQQEAIEEVPEPGGDPSEAIQARACERAVRKILEEIPEPRDREVLARYYLYEEPRDVICRDLEIRDDRFWLVVQRARDRFRRELKKLYQRSDLLGVLAAMPLLALVMASHE